jgi:hypothetical protein
VATSTPVTPQSLTLSTTFRKQLTFHRPASHCHSSQLQGIPLSEPRLRAFIVTGLLRSMRPAICSAALTVSSNERCLKPTSPLFRFMIYEPISWAILPLIAVCFRFSEFLLAVNSTCDTCDDQTWHLESSSLLATRLSISCFQRMN